MHQTWGEVFDDGETRKALATVLAFLEEEEEEEERKACTVYPPIPQVMRAFWLTPLNRVRAVILGQDPYHGAGQAHGLAFSVPAGVACPPSLRNVLMELSSDLGLASSCCSVCASRITSSEGTAVPSQYHSHDGRAWFCSHTCHSGDLTKWAERGVLLLNTCLTVRQGQAGSHRGCGWEQFTRACLRAVAQQSRPIAFLLWGRDAQQQARAVPEVWALGEAVVTNHAFGTDLHRPTKHVIVESPHPSPMATGFRGSRPFSRANDGLIARGAEPIDWSL